MTWDKQKNRIYIQMMEMTVYHDSIKSHKHVEKKHYNCGWIDKMRHSIQLSQF